MPNSILNQPMDLANADLVKTTLQKEADVIVSSVILGFIFTRYYQGQPCQFDIEHPTDEQIKKWQEADKDPSKGMPEDYLEYLQEQQEFLDVMSALAIVVDKREAGMGKWLKDGQSAFGKEGKLITGKKGGEMIDHKKRATPLSYSKARMLKNALANKDTVYQGRGAYTGLVDNPITENNNLYPTMRVNVPVGVRDWAGFEQANNPYVTPDINRFYQGDQNAVPWGIILANKCGKLFNLDPDRSVGMGKIPPVNDISRKDLKVGYVHGMCTAIVKSRESGPWCTPFEMGTGKVTTKMASCFPCTTYMYNAGYPPSSTHLGRGESWVPPQDYNRLEYKDNEQAPVAQCNCNESISDNLLQGWNREIFKQMLLGVEHLENITDSLLERDQPYVDSEYYHTIANLNDLLERQFHDSATGWQDDEIRAKGGQLFLDALTIHDKEINRLKRTFQPAVDTFSFMQEQSLDFDP